MDTRRNIPLEMDKSEFKKLGYQLIDTLSDFLSSIDQQQSIFNYFYSKNREALDGDFLSPKAKSLNQSSGSTASENEHGNPSKAPLRRTRTDISSSPPRQSERKSSL